MSTQIDFRTLPANVPVLCIPRVYSNISESRIRRIFDDLNMGELDRIDIVSGKHSAKPEEKFNRVFVHFRRWNNSENANVARERLLNGKEIKIIYDEPWFWKISAYREPERKPTAPQNTGGHRKPTLQFDSDEDRPSNSRHVTSSYRHPDTRPRQQDSRRHYNREQEDVRPRHYNREQNSRPRENPSHDKKTVHKSTTPPCSPPGDMRFERDDSLPTKIEYGNVKPPMRKKRITLEHEETKKSEDKKEDGEIA